MKLDKVFPGKNVPNEFNVVIEMKIKLPRMFVLKLCGKLYQVTFCIPNFTLALTKFNLSLQLSIYTYIDFLFYFSNIINLTCSNLIIDGNKINIF